MALRTSADDDRDANVNFAKTPRLVQRMAADYIETFEMQLQGRSRASSVLRILSPRLQSNRPEAHKLALVAASQHQPQPA